MAERDGQQLGQYRLIRLLGGSEIAETYLGEHLFFKTLAAIKVLKAPVPEQGMPVFLSKMSTIVGLLHSNIVRTLDSGVQGGVFFHIMEYAPKGAVLRQSFASGNPIGPAMVASLVERIASALQYAHDQNIMHGNIKPENILVGVDNEVLLSDFGLATILRTTSLWQARPIENNGYMAPEQMEGGPQPASDQYALAVIAYKWLNGKLPSRDEDNLSGAHREAPTHRDTPEISPEISEVLSTAMERDPARRFGSVRAFAQTLFQACAEDERVALAIPAENQFSLATEALNSLFERSTQGEVSQAEVATSRRELNEYASPYDTNRTLEAYGVQENLALQQSELESQKGRGTSRRAVLIGVGCSAVTVGGIAALIVSGKVSDLFARVSPKATTAPISHRGQLAAPTSGPTTHPTETTQVSLGTTRTAYTGQSSDVTGVCWSPNVDGRTVASCSQDGSAATWNALSGTVDLVFPQSGALSTLVWSPNGQYIASGGADNIVTIWDASSGNVVVTCSGHTQTVLGLAWSPDNRSIVSTSQDYSAIVWDVATGNKLVTYTGHSNYVWSVTWAPAGSAIATGSWDNTVQIWNPGTGSLILRYPTTGPVRAVDWSPDGSLIASGGDDNIVQIWYAANGTVQTTYNGHSDHIEAVQWSPDGQYVASASKDTTVQIWQASDASGIYTYRGHSGLVWSLAWSPDGQLIVSGSQDRTAKVWQAV